MSAAPSVLQAIPGFPEPRRLAQDVAAMSSRWGEVLEERYAWLDAWLRAWNRHDLADLTPLIAADLVWSDPIMAGDVVRGRDGFRHYIETFWRGFPDVRFDATGAPLLDPSADRMAVSWRMTGRMTGPLAWWGTRYGDSPPTWSPTGKRADIEGYDVYVFRDGLLAEYTIVADFLTLSQQLGLMPPTDGVVTKLMLGVQHLTAPLVRRRQPG